MLGILLINKPIGITSHDAVYRVRRSLGIKRVGHSGTLDPNASGLLVMAIGHATRFLQYLALEPKEYIGSIRFGIETNTQDSEGQATRVREVPHLDLAAVRSAAEAFLGQQEQVPPMFSAVKVGGERLYKSARRGEEVERQPRIISVHEFEILHGAPEQDSLRFRCVCSGGTYVRTLAADLGERLGFGAHLASLTRTRVGRFDLNEAIEPDEAAASRLISLEEALSPMPMVRLPEEKARMARHGNPVQAAAETDSGLIGLLDASGLFAVARRSGALWQPECVVPLT
jgi:tRNA pseudouridine55 synthase